MKYILAILITFLSFNIYAQKSKKAQVPPVKQEVVAPTVKTDSVAPVAQPVFTAISSDTAAPILILYLDDKLQLVSEVGYAVVQQGYIEKDGRKQMTTITQPVVTRTTTTSTTLPGGKEDKKSTNTPVPIEMNRVIYLMDNQLNVVYRK